MADHGSNGRGGNSSTPTDELSEEFRHLLSAVAGRVLSSANDHVGNVTDKLSGVGEGGGATASALGKAGEKTAEGKSPLVAGLSAAGEGIKSKVSSAFGGGGKGGKGGKKNKVTNIIEEIDIGAPIELVYNQWTQFQDYSNFMKKVEGVDQKDEQKVTFKAQVLWSHRTWESTIVEQVPESRIVWKSSGEKGKVDGAVTFHELADDLTRVLVVLEYHPQGLFERTGNLWRAQGRRVRLELKHFRRQVMTQSLLHPDDVEGWRGEIHDSEVTKSDEDARAEQDEQDQPADEAEDDYDDEAESDEYDDEADDEDEADNEDEDDEPDDEYDDEAEDDYDDEADEDDEDGDERPQRRARSRRPARSGGGRR